MTGRRVPGTPTTINEVTHALATLQAKVWGSDSDSDTSDSDGGSERQGAQLDPRDRRLFGKIVSSAHGEVFLALWSGQPTSADPNTSDDDAALVERLAWWLNRDAARIDRWFRTSSRMRPKWDAIHHGGTETYGAHLVRIAITEWVKEGKGYTGEGEEGDSFTAGNGNKIVSRALNTVVAEPIPWFWKNYLPRRQVSVLAAPGGSGKTHMLFDLTARATLGLGMPNGGAVGEPVAVAIVTSENDAGTIARPQIEASMRRLLGRDPDADAKIDAALARIEFIDGVSKEVQTNMRMTVPLSFPDDTRLLRDFLIERQIKLLYFDPLISFTSSAVNTSEQSDVRRMMDGLRQVALELDMTIIAVIHFNKNAEGEFINRVIGSRQYTDFARMVLTVVVEGRDDDPASGGAIRRWLASAKCNLVKDPEAISFFIEGERDQPSLVRWDYTKEARAEDIDAELHGDKTSKRGGARAGAADRLRKRCIALWLEGREFITAEELEALRLAVDVSKETWVKAKSDVGIKTTKSRHTGGWIAPLVG